MKSLWTIDSSEHPPLALVVPLSGAAADCA